MASIPAVFALITQGIEEKFVAECTKNNLIELFLNKLVTIHFVHLALAFADGALTAQASIKGSFPDIFFHCEK